MLKNVEKGCIISMIFLQEGHGFARLFEKAAAVIVFAYRSLYLCYRLLFKNSCVFRRYLFNNNLFYTYL